MRRLLLLGWLSLSACDINLRPGDGGTGGGGGGTLGAGGGSGGGSGGAGGGAVQSMTPPSIDLSVFSGIGSGAAKLLAEVGNSRLELDPTKKDALTALGSCADLISYCYAPGTATVSQCFARVRKCTTAEPWNEPQPCCADACATAFEDEVALGASHVDALEKVLFRGPAYCMPGVRELMEAP